ncbi:uncharacterized protein LOC122648908 isoform X2 [Telopea speciosissima]|uniref:uncharacterized protein LOC122648908 isoform X2 n=1 Tax=Telopea speciosissima TaxID=54955 RepID=UPI001CC57F60|nr:uncharacterized protein LOC122648908 isoform X2 [Telopea speciosissima]
MEATTAAQSLAFLNLTKPLCFSTFPSSAFFHSQNSIFASHSPTSLAFKFSSRKLLHFQPIERQVRNLTSLNASAAESPSSDNVERWLLEPVGDGDSRHIGFQVPMPDAFEITSSVVTVGRLPDKADMVIPVATVSGLHARIEKKRESLLVTDLDSTNGTFIDDKRIRPGAVGTASPGSCIIFGKLSSSRIHQHFFLMFAHSSPTIITYEYF